MTSMLQYDVKACLLDAYGTLFDFAAATRGCRDILGADLDKLTVLWRATPIHLVARNTATTRGLLAGDGRRLGLCPGDVEDRSTRPSRPPHGSVSEALGFSGGADVLRRLKAAGLKTAILSNGSPTMLDAAVRNAAIHELLDAVLSVEDVGVYKPDSAVYRLGIPPEQICFLSSNSWDAYAASAFGMRVVWCNRYGKRPERVPGRPDREIRTLADLPELVGVATGS